MKHYREVLGKVEGMQRGFTSGSSAQAAAKGAVELLLSGIVKKSVEITLKGGIVLSIPIHYYRMENDFCECGVLKDSGDDSDITHGYEFRAKAQWSENPGLTVLGGQGVGTVTAEGLPVKPGLPAINPGPMKMIHREIEPLIPHSKGIIITISVPYGESLAGETWNPRLGIEGGISIIGTSGIVEPKSSAAYKASIALAVKVREKQGDEVLHLTPGYVGEAFFGKHWNLPLEKVVKIGDHVGYALDCGSSKSFDEICLAGHIGKMAKVAAGLFNTHCEYGDARLETLSAFAAAAGASREDVIHLLNMKMAEGAVPFLQERSLEEAFLLMNKRIIERVELRIKKPVRLRSIILDLKGQPLSEVSNE